MILFDKNSAFADPNSGNWLTVFSTSSPGSPEPTPYAPFNVTAPSLNTVSIGIGDSVTGDTGTWDGLPEPTVQHQWEYSINGTSWSVADEMPLTFTADDPDIYLGLYIRLAAQAENSEGVSDFARSEPSEPIYSAPIADRTSATMNGTPTVAGSAVTLTSASLGYPTPTFTFQWQQSTNGTDWTNISGATSSTYVPAVGIESRHVRAAVTATNIHGSVTANTNSAIAVRAPSATGYALSASTVYAGSAITVNTGTWVGHPTPTVAVQWQSLEGSTWTNISGATTTSFTPTGGYVDKSIRAVVTGTNSVGSQGYNTGTATVLAALTAPVRVSGATINGTTMVGETLTASPVPVYSGNPTPTVTWQWQTRPEGGGTINQIQTGGDLLLTGDHIGLEISIRDQATNSQGTSAWTTGTWTAAIEDIPAPARVTLTESEEVSVAGHSFLCFSFGYTNDYRGSLQFPDHWSGQTNINYAGYSTLKSRWDDNGPDRTEAAYDALWLSEFTNPGDGNWPTPDSPQGMESLQYLYWYALTAQAKDAKAVFLLPPWSPQGMDIDGNTMSTFQYWVEWLESKPEVTIPIFVIPAPVIVRDWANEYGNVWDDGLHLSHDDPSGASANNPFCAGAMGIAFKMMMTGEREIDGGWSSDMDEAVGMAWSRIQEYECTGFGGSTTVTPIAVAEDPLPTPLPLPA